MKFKIIFYAALLGAFTFGVFSLVFYFGDWERLYLVTLCGFFVGVLAAPEFEPKKFKYGWLLQILAGAVAGALLGVVFLLSIELIISCSIIGGFVGWLSPLWIKYISIP
ncbi:MAG: hypothetical protein V4732_07720 [Pseudomonadota bacterium]